MSAISLRERSSVASRGALTGGNSTPNRLQPLAKASRTPGLLDNKKLIKNAMCTDWPSYFLGNKNTIVINKTG